MPPPSPPPGDYSWPAYVLKGAHCVGRMLVRDHPRAVASLALWGGLKAARALKKWYVPRGTVLELDLDAVQLVDGEMTPLARLRDAAGVSVRSVCDALKAAEGDPRVAGVVVRLGNTAEMGDSMMTAARAELLHAAVASFRAAGKLTVAYADTVGEAGGDGALPAYYFASAFEHFFLAPSGSLTITDAAAESMFVSRALGKLGVKPQLYGRKEYKNMVNFFTETDLTEAHREAVTALVQSQRATFFAGVARGRGTDGGAEAVAEAVAAGPFLADEALRRGLVDGLLYRDEVYERVAGMLGRDGGADALPLLYLSRYAAKAAGRLPHVRGKHRFALIEASGGIHRGESERDWTGTATSIGSDTLCRAIRAAAADKKVRAIILSVDSRGGSYVASDQVAREVIRAKEAGKRVVAVMGNVAASGGYFVSQNADRIVASESTITGSIGVVFGKFVFAGAYDKLGVDWGVVEPNAPNSRAMSHLREFSPDDEKTVNEHLDAIYSDFVAKAAAGRGMEVEELERAARGRVWTGADALRLGLVDEIGGVGRAVEVAKDLLGLGDKDTVRLVPFPRKQPCLLSRLFAGGPANSRERDRRGAAAAAVPSPTAASLLGAGLSGLAGGFGGFSGAGFSGAGAAMAVLDAVRRSGGPASAAAELRRRSASLVGEVELVI